MQYTALLVLPAICIIHGRNFESSGYGDGWYSGSRPSGFGVPYDRRPIPPPGGGGITGYPEPGRNICPTLPPITCNCNCGGARGDSKNEGNSGTSGSRGSVDNAGSRSGDNNGNAENHENERNDGPNVNNNPDGNEESGSIYDIRGRSS
ncbi:dermokine-like [Centruroides vittatus]|uniref:dermokine-like n=1 Tax=Centruroides vittatus TaxID=120091 RepID=UPI0035102DC9